MISKLLSQFHHWELIVLAFLKPLGFWGVGVAGVIDAASIAMPMDLFIATYVWGNHSQFWVYVLVGAMGAAVGSVVPFYIGRAGGELVLLKHVDAAKYEKIRARFDRHHWFAVMIPAAMPPPFPFKLFAFGAGVFEMRVLPYMGAVFVGRFIHYLATALLVLYFGPEIVDMLTRLVKGHLVLILVGVAIATIVFLVFVFHRRRRNRQEIDA